MNKKRRSHTKNFKTEVAVSAIKERATQAQLASKYNIHPSQIKEWKQQALQAITENFASNPKQTEALESSLYEHIGKLSIENDFLKKKLNDFEGKKG